MSTQLPPLGRLLVFCLGLMLVVILVGQVRLVIGRDGAFYAGSDTPVGNDFLVFYTAGRIVADGDGAELYDPTRQQAEQREILGRERGLAIFPYPAFVASPYALVARLPLVWAWLVVTLAMAGAVIAAVAMLRTVSPTVRAFPLVSGLAILASQPLLAALFGGQTVTFSLLAMTGIYTGLRRDHQVAAGIWLGLLLYKPQLAAVLIVLLLIQRRWRVLGIAAGVGAGLAVVGALASGPRWPVEFLRLTMSGYYRDNAAIVDGISSISLPGVAEWMVGPDATWVLLPVVVACAGIVAMTARAWRGAAATDVRFPLLFGVAVVTTLVINPHALFYEAALLVLPMVLLVDYWRGAAARGVPRGLSLWRLRILVGLFLLGSARSVAEIIGVQPLALLPVAVGALLWWELRPETARVLIGRSIGLDRSEPDAVRS